MRKLRLAAAASALLAFAATAAAACEGTPGGPRLLISVDGVRNSQGLMTASLYGSDPERFLVKNGALKVWRVPARATTTPMCLWLKAPGVYGVAIYHDENSNLKFDVGTFGPKEGYGFSENPRILFSKPSLRAVAFTAHAGDNVLHIRLRYP